MLVVTAALIASATQETLPPGTWNRGPAWVQGFARWDSGYYLDIATQGYGFKPDLWAFHPGYPLVIVFFQSLLPGLAPETVGFLVSNACFFIAVPVFYRLTRDLFDAGVALRASLALAFFPGAFFFSAIYPESLFILILSQFFWTVVKERWVLAGLLASAAISVRPQGVFLVPVLLGAIGMARRAGRTNWPAAWVSPVLALVFPAGFSYYAWAETGDAFRWFHARETFWPEVGWHDPLTKIVGILGGSYGFSALSLLLLLAAAGFVFWDVRTHRRTKAYPAYSWSVILFVVYVAYAGGSSLLRYLLPILPLYWMVGFTIKRPSALAAVLVLSALLSCTAAALFATWKPVY